jgi:hypothetical protein
MREVVMVAGPAAPLGEAVARALSDTIDELA